MSTIQNTNHQKTNYIQIITKEITNISTGVTCPTEEVSSYVLLSWDVFHSRTIGNIKQENNYVLENIKVLNNPKW